MARPPIRRALLALAAALVPFLATPAPVRAGTPAPPPLGQPEDDIPTGSDLFVTSTKPTFGATPPAVGLRALLPSRLVDTRFSRPPLTAGEVLSVTAAGAGGVPATGASAVVVNLTVTEPAAVGYATVYPCGAAPPDVSSLNYKPGETVPNLVTVMLGEAGAFCVVTSAPAHVIADVTGYYGAGGAGFASVAPVRLLDSRAGGAKPIAAGTVVSVPLASRGGVPANGVSGASLNVTATSATATGFVTVFPCGGAAPNASSLNVVAGATVANSVVTATDTAGSVCLVPSVAMHVIVDLNGWFGTAALGSFSAVQPVRIVDTRSGPRITANAAFEVSVGVQTAVALNITVAEPLAAGFVTVWPCGLPKPNASNLNFAKGEAVANAVSVGVGSGGKVCMASSAAAHLIVDYDGQFRVANSDETVLSGPAAFVIQWAFTQIGNHYASINPYRFGDSIYGKPWDCPDGQPVCSRVDMFGKTRTVAAGSYVYDCSGLVVAAWLRGGVDLVKLNAGWSDVMFKNLPHIAREQVQTGDLLLFNYGDSSVEDPTDHVALYLNDKEMLHSGSCANYSGVCLRSIDWSSVVAIARVPHA